ncbi:hypothetical protein N658DRAFT_421064 [Parathielavia hyrcaniae]|uniref:Origin recognition complex subunit 4 n=1 Tax=Parathielavia hyrcaniae TaxID=113614 RepID=A0AAN6Q658_9PEZI|nr:hypothetical protein N658DRAFT_421064 [Parathielavia hyrcaniae]
MVGRNNSAVARKRTRPQTEDEPSSTAKKPRTRLSKASPADAGGDEDSQEPKLASVANGTLKRGLRATAARPAKGTPADSEEVPGSEEESATQPKQPAQRQKGRPPRQIFQASAASQRSSVYDVPDSDEDELTAAAVEERPERHKPNAATAARDEVDPAGAKVGGEAGKKKRGRPSKQDREAQAKVQHGEVPPSPRQSVGPGRSGARGIPPFKGQAPDNGVAARKSPVQKAAHREAGANGTLAKDVELPKGILTPRKGRARGDFLRKSVAFDQSLNEGLSEEPLSSLAAESPSKSARKRRQAAAGLVDEIQINGKTTDNDRTSSNKSESEEEDDQVCAICSKPDSEPPNEIVFCDNCDMPVHQECYGLPEIPEGDWICRNCSQDDATAVSHGTANQAMLSMVARADQRPDIPNFDHHLRLTQRVLLDRCAGRRRIKPRGQNEAYEKTFQLVEQTVVAGEGNSMMVIGARGCGKTTSVESVVNELSNRHQDQFHVVRLSGFIHTDDKLALREIWRQLGKEMEVEDDLVNKTTNYADTMASLLALLSHPSEIAETQDGVTSKSVIFVIDEFDLFATHARQTLLYNLFDIAQARKAPIAVLGLTTRVDVVESLEKRVKSRFSHRSVYLSLPKSLPAYWDVCRQGLTIDDEDMVSEGIDPKAKGHREFWDWWNGRIESLYKSQGFLDHLESHFFSTKSASAFLTTCILPLAALSPSSPSLKIPAGAELAVALEPPDSKLHLLGSLSDLDLSMLIAAARLDIVAHTDTVNFAMAYDEYTSLMSKQRVQSAGAGVLALGGGARVWGRGTAGIAWERLVALGLLVPAAAGGRGTAGLGGLDAKMWKVDVALEEIPAAVKLNAVLARWCREI